MQIAAIGFTDLGSGDDAIAVVRVEGRATGLALSLKRNGDIEVFLGLEELDQVIKASQEARSMLPGVKSVM